jgi:hypothetical protein
VESGLKIKAKATAKTRGGKRTELAGTGGAPGGYFERALGGEADRKWVQRDEFSGLQWTTPDPPNANKIFKKFEQISTATKAGAAGELAGGGSRRGAGGGKGIANCELGIVNCKLRISGFQPEAVQLKNGNGWQRNGGKGIGKQRLRIPDASPDG